MLSVFSVLSAKTSRIRFLIIVIIIMMMMMIIIVIVIVIIIIVFRFRDEYLVSVLSSAHAGASVSLAGKRDSRSHSTMRFSENVVVAGTGYHILEVSTFCNRQRAKPSPIKITALIFSGEKLYKSFPG